MIALVGGEEACRDGLRRLAEMDPRKVQEVQLRLSDELTDEQISARLEVTLRTWAWLYKESS